MRLLNLARIWQKRQRKPAVAVRRVKGREKAEKALSNLGRKFEGLSFQSWAAVRAGF